MEDKRVYPRITITLQPDIIARLPKRDRSAFINLVLKQHFVKDSAEELYQFTKNRLMKDKDMNDWIVATVKETR